jgi:hypothetical protein
MLQLRAHIRAVSWLNLSLLPLVLVAAMVSVSAAAPAFPGDLEEQGAAAFSPSVRLLEGAVERGELTYSEAAVQKLLYLFDRTQMNAEFNVEGLRPARCGTLILDELGRNRDLLDVEARALFDRYTLTRADDSFPTQALNVYETTNFYIEYQDNGPHAVPLDDLDPVNGTPDYIEHVGVACENSWSVSVTTLGYNPPPASSATQYNGKYLIQFQSQSSYGYTTVTTGSRTKIVLHPDYVSFPPNDDPDGNELGAMRVTVAHELKHAIQRTYTSWTEGGWVELDATWMEDIVYDGVNDYYNYIFGGGSPFSSPDLPLDDDGTATTGSYEDCNWQHYQSERFGNGHILNFWLRRDSNPGEAVIATYDQNLIASGSSLQEAWGEYAAWNFASGAHAGSGLGYGEAADYPTTPATAIYTTLPIATTAGTVEHLAANTHYASNPYGALGGVPEFTFSGDAAIEWSVGVLLEDLAGNLTLEPMTLAAGSGSLNLAGYDWADLNSAALVIGNAEYAGPAGAYTFSAQAISPLHITHQKLWNTIETAQPYSVTATVYSGTETLDPSSIVLEYSVDGAPVQSVPMVATGGTDEYEADVPAQEIGTGIEYRIVALSTMSDTVSSPATEGVVYDFEIVTVFEPFESPGSWTVGYAGDTASRGVWERVIPVSTSAQPGADFTSPPGEYCFVTENALPTDPLGEADVDGGKTTLVSPVFDLGTGGPYESVTVRYRRWYSNEQGQTVDDTWRVYVTNDGSAETLFETTTEGSPVWALISSDLLAIYPNPGDIQFRFVAEDQGGGSIVEVGIDDFEIIAIPSETVDAAAPLSAGLRMGPMIPNPLTVDGASFSLELPSAGPVQATVIDARGRVMRTLLPAGSQLPAGRHRLEWDGRADGGARLSSGIYFVRVVSEQGVAERKVLLLR